MLGWLGSIFGGRRSPQDQPSRASANAKTPRVGIRRKIVLRDARHIEAALVELEKVGLKFNPDIEDSVRQAAEEIAEELQGISFSHEPTLGDWALIALSGEFQPFKNAISFSDHCFDGFEAEDFSSMISRIIRLAGNDWPFGYVEVRDAGRPEGPLQYEQPVTVTIHATPEVPPFDLIYAKDFDWSLVLRLNERLPEGVQGRFSIFWDGNARIVFLAPERLQCLNSLCGYEFLHEEASNVPSA
jgi:hypothetical protein